MILHIIRKDLRLLWKVIILVAAVQAVLTTMLFHIDHSATTKNPYGLLLQLILFMTLLGRAVLIVMCVQQDAIPGVNQDWLTRPVRRTDLLLAKLGFVMIFVQGPVFLSDFLQAIANGAPICLAFITSFSRTVFVTLIVALPFVAFGALTENLTQAIAGAVIFFLILAGGQMLFVGLNEGRRILEISPTTLTGLDWMTDAIRLVIALAAVMTVLALQYFQRKTQFARIVLVSGALLCFAARLLPWTVAYGFQRHITRQRDDGKAITIQFDSSRSRETSLSGMTGDLLHGQFGGTSDDAVVYLPVKIGGLPGDSLLKTDRIEARMTVPGGKVFRLGAGDDFQPLPHAGSNTTDTFSPIYLPEKLLQQYKDVPVDLEIIYSATEMTLADSEEMDALRGQKYYRSLGSCTSGINSGETQIAVRCLKPGSIPLCTTTLLKARNSSIANPPVSSCSPNYAPIYPVIIPDGTSRFSANLPFRDPNGMALYPIRGADIANAVVDLKIYEPVTHIQRTLSIPDVLLASWTRP